jgi:hypothetical protein
MARWRARRAARAAPGPLALAALLLACGGSAGDAASLETRRDAPLVEHVVLAPPRPLPGTALLARVEAVDPRGGPLRFHFAWSVNDRLVEEGSRPAFNVPADLNKHDRIGLRVTARSERLESDPVEVVTHPKNRGPILHEISIGPDEDVHAGVDLELRVVASDPDADPLRLDYQWFVNDREVEEGSTRFDTTQLRRGDRVHARVQVSDGEAEPVHASSATIILGNAPPEILPVEALRGEDGVFRHSFEARDPDGDRELRFRLVEGPPGAWIDPMLGILEWRPGPGQHGTHVFEVAVEDGHGAETALRFELQVEVEGSASATGATSSRALLASDRQGVSR